PAKEAGLKAGDVITKINDREVKDYRDLIRTLNFYNPGEKVTVYYSRKGSKKNVSVTLAEKKRRGPRPGRMMKMKKGDGSMQWFDKDGENINIRKRIKRIHDDKHDKNLPHLRFRVI
ncbi:MAG: PDZ domain-containing protein, partial [Calditrichaceae bacterium]